MLNVMVMVAMVGIVEVWSNVLQRSQVKFNDGKLVTDRPTNRFITTEILILEDDTENRTIVKCILECSWISIDVQPEPIRDASYFHESKFQ